MKRKNHTPLGRLARGIFHLLRAILQLLREILQLLREIKSAILQFAESSSREREKARATRGNEEMRNRTIRLSRPLSPEESQHRKERQMVVREIKRRHDRALAQGHRISYRLIIREMRQSSAYRARMKGVSDASWYRYTCQKTI